MGALLNVCDASTGPVGSHVLLGSLFRISGLGQHRHGCCPYLRERVVVHGDPVLTQGLTTMVSRRLNTTMAVMRFRPESWDKVP